MNRVKKAVVGVVCDLEQVGPHPFHIAGNKYLQAIIGAADCVPILIPALADLTEIDAILSIVDGILLPGGYSMVDPLNYQHEPADSETKLDIARDQTSLPIIKEAIAMGVPIFGICRGFQEMNVALGGSLHQALHHHEQYIEHRENKSFTLEQQYADAHPIALSSGGLLAKIMNSEKMMVNSLHTQGIDRLASDLTLEAVSEDGLCEAFSVSNASSFALAVQWHPEWQVMKNNNNRKLFEAFGAACKNRNSARTQS